MATHYAIRLTLPRTHPLVADLKSLSTGKWALAEELGTETGKKHCHIWLETTKSEQTIRNRILKHVEKGNKSYSMTKVKDGTKYLAYLLKESIEPEVERFSEEEKKDALEYKEQLKKTLKKKSTIIDELRERASKTPAMPKEELMRMVLDYHVENGMIIRKHQIMAYFYTLYCEQGSTGLLVYDWVKFL